MEGPAAVSPAAAVGGRDYGAAAGGGHSLRVGQHSQEDHAATGGTDTKREQHSEGIIRAQYTYLITKKLKKSSDDQFLF